MKILVTGGAGYIGSHVVKELGLRSEDVVVLDNLSTGHKKAVLFGNIVVGDLADRKLLDELFSKHKFESVMHFAGSIVVPESVIDPLKYYQNNTANTLNLLEMCVKYKTKNFIFSSTAAVYAMPEDGVCREDSKLAPNNPYGFSKLMCEQIIWDCCKVNNIQAVVLRYFNVAGADPEGQIGQSTIGVSSLIKVCVEAAAGKREYVEVFGTDYPTYDGTGIRDFIHVSDLAQAHACALEYLQNGGETVAINCGYGHGFSVKEVIDSIKKVSGVNFLVKDSPKRVGDYANIISESKKIHSLFKWDPKYDDLDLIIKTALSWERNRHF